MNVWAMTLGDWLVFRSGVDEWIAQQKQQAKG